jgi:hypothetical protein
LMIKMSSAPKKIWCWRGPGGEEHDTLPKHFLTKTSPFHYLATFPGY